MRAAGFDVPVDTSSIEGAGTAAEKAGATIRYQLDTTVKPVVDTASIDAAVPKVDVLKAAIGGDAMDLSVIGARFADQPRPLALPR